MSRRRRQRADNRPRCKDCRAEVRFFRDENDRWRMVNARPVDGRTSPQGAMPEWGNRLWNDHAELAAELSTRRPIGTDVVDEVLDLPWYRRHLCQVDAAIADRLRQKEDAPS